MINLIFNFLNDNHHPSDDEFHSFCEQNGLDTHQAESIVYAIAAKMVKLLRGGKYGETGLDVNSVDPSQLDKGIQVEYEHTPDMSVAKKIALDHLAEHPQYYDYLEQMEQSWGEATGSDDQNSETPREKVAKLLNIRRLSNG